MSRKKERDPIQKAITALRQQIGLTQNGLAFEMEVAILTISRWETSKTAVRLNLYRLWDLAREYGLTEIAKVFEEAWLNGGRRGVRRQLILRRPGRVSDTALNDLRLHRFHPLIDPDI